MAGLWGAVKGMFSERKLTAAEEAELADLRNRKIGAANGTSVTYRDVLYLINQYVDEKEAEGGVLGGTPGPHEVIRSGKLQGTGPKFPIRFDSTAMLRLYNLLGSKGGNSKGGSRRNRRRKSRRQNRSSRRRQSRRN